MIRKLQLKFVAICMALVTLVLSVVFFSAWFSFRRQIEVLSREVLQRVMDGREYYDDSSAPTAGGLPIFGYQLGSGGVRLPYFTVSLWRSGERYSAYVTGGNYGDLQDTEELSAILKACLDQEADEGVIGGDYALRYLRQDNGLYEKLVFVDVSMEQATLRELGVSFLKITAAALAVLLALSVLLSRWAVAPVERAWKQQRQFLSDASHELKTPLTVILSNAELLEGAALDPRPARWADNIRSEAGQMKVLVEEMLTLARADNAAPAAVHTAVSLSDLADGCVLAFEPVAFEAGKNLNYQIPEGVEVLGDAGELRQLISILLDNAIKYGAEGGTVLLTLGKTDRQAKLTVSNPGEPIPPEQLKHLFERFYRADGSRGEQSGFGLGLPIARTIAAEHKGTLKAESDQTSTRFIFTMPVKRGNS